MPTKGFSYDWKQQSASATAMKKFEEGFGGKYGVELGHVSKITPYQVIPTGSLALDQALVVGGWPRGRINEIWGPEHVAKTSLMILACAEAQKAYPDQIPGWVDMEQSFDESWADQLGLDLNRFWRPKRPPRTAEEGVEMMIEMVKSGMCSIVVFDSIGSMITTKEYEKAAEEDIVAATARVVTRAVKKISPMAFATNTAVSMINQTRANISAYGGATTRTGGWALRHLASTVTKLSRGGEGDLTVRENGQTIPVGQEVVAKIEKNKVGPRGNVANMFLLNRPSDLYGPVGLDRCTEAMQFGIDTGLVVPDKGTWYVMPDGTRLNGRGKVTSYFREHTELIPQVRELVLAGVSAQVVDSELPDPDEIPEEL